MLPILYRLDKGSAYEQRCFPPCLCPILISEAVQGTFVLTPAGFDGLFSTYAVSEVRFKSVLVTGPTPFPAMTSRAH